jgi:Cu(I)/Ag(I) efflux system membrane protein CusA/SilA
MLARLLWFCLNNKFLVLVIFALVVFWGLRSAPFDWTLGGLPRDPVPVDAIPDIGENQQIVFTEWTGRSPQDVEDQIGYPLTVSLLGLPGVKSVRSYSMFGFSSIYVIFHEDVDFYGSRSRILEKLSSLPAGTLPENVQPVLGPDATGLGQVLWYTLEGRDQNGNPAGGWSLNELRSIQDWYVRYQLQATEGVSEAASVGGFVQEYQIDVDPDAMRAFGVKLTDVFNAVQMANLDVGARSIEVNSVEYFIRGLGFVKSASDLESTVVKVNDNVPVYVRNVATVQLGPALRRGALDKGGVEAVGGVVVVRYGENPLTVIKAVKQKIQREIAPGLPEKLVVDWTQTTPEGVAEFAVTNRITAPIQTLSHAGLDATQVARPPPFALDQEAWLAWYKTTPESRHPAWLGYSKVTLVPFYDRTGLIYETLGTLKTAITLEILVTLIVILVMVRHLASSTLIAGLLPLAVLMTFIAMRQFGVDANIVALSGIAIAIGTMVDMGIVICENILQKLRAPSSEAHEPHEKNPAPHAPRPSSLQLIFEATREVGPAVLTAVATTIVGFLPVFAMEGAEGKLFKPLAFTKTFALVASIVVALTLLPALFHAWVRLGDRFRQRRLPNPRPPASRQPPLVTVILTALAVIGVAWLLATRWLPFGADHGSLLNLIVVALIIGGLLLFFLLFQGIYTPLLRWALDHKLLFLSLPTALVLLGATVWLGFDRVLGWLPAGIRGTRPMTAVAHAFPGLGKEFMPSLDEGSFLFMPTTMAHASIGEALDVLATQDLAIQSIPEVASVVGKLGRADSALDPAPVSMFETIINYHPQFLADSDGNLLRFKFDASDNDLFRNPHGQPLNAPDGKPYNVHGRFHRDPDGHLVPDSQGAPFRLWRPALEPQLNENRTAWTGIRNPNDIWEEISTATVIPGTTLAPKLQPIETRIIMLQTGMRAPMGVKVKGPDLATIERVGLEIEQHLKEVPGVRPNTVLADRIVGKPYLEIEIDREAIARYGLHIKAVQDVIEVGIGGKTLTRTVEGRERYPVRVRYLRELRDNIESLDRIIVPAPDGTQIPLTQLAEIRYTRGPQVIKSEDTFLTGYVTFDREASMAEVDLVERCQRHLQDKIASGEFQLPAGVSYIFSGNFENQVRATRKLQVVVPVALLIIFLILYLQFRSTVTSMLVFSGVFVAWAGGFLMLWFYGQDWFLNVSVFGDNLRDLLNIHPVNLSVAVWVGFLALFGIATDNGVIVASILDQRFRRKNPADKQAIREIVLEGAQRRIRPAVMTTATTLLALLPVLTSTGRGSDIMIPMAIPTFGGMAVAVVSLFVVPVLYCWVKEHRITGRPSSPAQEGKGEDIMQSSPAGIVDIL